MSARLQAGDQEVEGWRRILSEHIVKLRRDVQGADEAEAIHAVRKRCKIIRALIRLMRPIDREWSEKEGAAFRDFARSLAGFRDAEVCRRTLAKLPPSEPEGVDWTGLVTTPEETAPQTSSSLALEAGLPFANEAEGRFNTMPVVNVKGFAFLAPGLRQTYRAGRRGQHRAAEAKKGDSYHRWRKRVKDLGYQLRIVEGSWKKPIRAFRREVEKLGEILGLIQDHVMLRERLDKTIDLDEQVKLALKQQITHRMEELRNDAHRLGDKVFAAKPKEFIRMLRRCWRSWKG